MFRCAVIASWCLTYWLLASFSSEPVEWLGWVLGGQLILPADDAYRVAAVIAGLWLLIGLVLPSVIMARRQRRATEEGRDEKAQESG
jgi:hypothetical protein